MITESIEKEKKAAMDRQYETDMQKFLKLLDEEQQITDSIEIPKKKANCFETEKEYFEKCVLAEKEQLGSDNLLKINEKALEIVCKDFFTHDLSMQLLVRGEDEEDNAYYYRIIGVEKVIKRNQMLDLMKCVERINSIVYSNFKLQGFVKSLLHSKYQSYYENMDFKNDLVNSAYEELFIHICRYSGKYDITTFSKPHVIKGITGYIKDNISNMSSHYNEQYNKIRKEINRFKALGYSDAEASSVSRLMGCDSLKGISASTIAATLKYKEASITESFNPDYQTGGNKILNPEEEALKQERIETFRQIYDCLRPYQQFLLYAMNGEMSDVDAQNASFEYNEQLINYLKEDDMYNLIKTDARGCEYVRREIINRLYDNTLETARNVLPNQRRAYNRRKNERRDAYLDKYGSSVVFGSVNKNYKALTDEDEELIFMLDD